MLGPFQGPELMMSLTLLLKPPTPWWSQISGVEQSWFSPSWTGAPLLALPVATHYLCPVC